MQVRLRFFASLRERLGTGMVRSLRQGTTAGEAWEALARETPALRAMRVRFAVNEHYVDPGHRLADGDELAVFPPLSGGSP